MNPYIPLFEDFVWLLLTKIAEKVILLRAALDRSLREGMGKNPSPSSWAGLTPRQIFALAHRGP